MGPDSVGIGWTTAEGDEDGSGRYAMRSASDDEPYLTPGSAGDAGAAVEERLRDTHSWTWAVNTANGGLRDGTVRITLDAALPDAASRPAHGVLVIDYVYAHLDRWVIEDGARCEW